MKLKKGRYKIKVKAKGYKKSVVNIFLYKNISYDIVLKKEKKSKNIEKGTKNKKNTLTWEDRRSFGCKIDPTFCALTNDYEDITK